MKSPSDWRAAPRETTRLPPLALLPLLLAAGAVAERCSRTHPPNRSEPGLVAPPALPSGTGQAPPLPHPTAPCPVDTLPERGLCVPVPPAEAAPEHSAPQPVTPPPP